MSFFNWTDERCDELRQHWADGLSASQVAIEMGCVSRSAVIGKVHRLHLPVRRTLQASPNAWSPAAKRHKPKPKVARLTNHGNRFDVTMVNEPEPLPEPAVDDNLIPVEQRITSVLALEACHCRWPVGDPGKPGFFYCGSPTADMSRDPAVPYCAAHRKRAKGKPHRYDGAERHTSFKMISGKYA